MTEWGSHSYVFRPYQISHDRSHHKFTKGNLKLQQLNDRWQIRLSRDREHPAIKMPLLRGERSTRNTLHKLTEILTRARFCHLRNGSEYLTQLLRTTFPFFQKFHSLAVAPFLLSFASTLSCLPLDPMDGRGMRQARMRGAGGLGGWRKIDRLVSLAKRQTASIILFEARWSFVAAGCCWQVKAPYPTVVSVVSVSPSQVLSQMTSVSLKFKVTESLLYNMLQTRPNATYCIVLYCVTPSDKFGGCTRLQLLSGGPSLPFITYSRSDYLMK